MEAKDDSAVDFGEVTPIEDDTEDEELLVEDLSLELNRRRRDAEDMFPRKRVSLFKQLYYLYYSIIRYITNSILMYYVLLSSLNI